jgi:hypothetical protein
VEKGIIINLIEPVGTKPERTTYLEFLGVSISLRECPTLSPFSKRLVGDIALNLLIDP